MFLPESNRLGILQILSAKECWVVGIGNRCFMLQPLFYRIFSPQIRMAANLLAFKNLVIYPTWAQNMWRTRWLNFTLSWLIITASVYTYLFYGCIYCLDFLNYCNCFIILESSATESHLVELGCYRNWIIN